MFTTISDDPKTELLQSRLARVAADIRLLQLPTREDYQAELYSRVNRILAMGEEMTPLVHITGEAPAVLGDVVENFSRLNRDGADIAAQILRTEEIAAQLYNLAAASQNSLRQQIRELALASNGRRYLEPFINTLRVDKLTASIDQDAGVVALPLVSEIDAVPTITLGGNSAGELENSLDLLTDGRVETAMVFNGSKIELILSYAKPVIINRLKIEMDDYQGLEITTLDTSPDGTHVENVLRDLGVDSFHLNSISSKYSGDFIIDFPPRHCSTIRMVIEDRVENARIALRSIATSSRRYNSVGRLTSKRIDAPSGLVRFTAEQQVVSPLTSVTHQISYNGVHFTVIEPGTEFTLTSTPFWYAAVLERSSSRFDDQDSPLEAQSADPIQSTSYVLSSSSSIILADGILERTLFFKSVAGPIRFRETPLPGTMRVQEGSVLLSVADFSFKDNVLSFPSDRGAVTVTYQASALGRAAVKQREEYYSPLLYEVRFEKVQ